MTFAILRKRARTMTFNLSGRRYAVRYLMTAEGHRWCWCDDVPGWSFLGSSQDAAISLSRRLEQDQTQPAPVVVTGQGDYTRTWPPKETK